MREHSLDEFESLFERASIPVFDIPDLELANIAAVISQTDLDYSVLGLAQYFKARFNSEVQVYWPTKVNEQHNIDMARKYNLSPASAYGAVEDLVAALAAESCRLLIWPISESNEVAEGELDTLVQSAEPPIFIVRQQIPQPSRVFIRVLHSLCGSLERVQHLAYSFSLVADQGLLVLMHTIEEHEIEEVRDTLKVSPEISGASGAALIADLTQHAERYLKGLVASSRDEPYRVQYRLGMGEVLQVVRHELSQGDYGLLVTGSHEHGHSDIAAMDYQLMHQVRDIPVLAL